MAVFKVEIDGHERLARGPAGGRPEDLPSADLSIDDLLAAGSDALTTATRRPTLGPVPATARVRAPVGNQEIWAAGVTYKRSREARMEESEVPLPARRPRRPRPDRPLPHGLRVDPRERGWW